MTIERSRVLLVLAVLLAPGLFAPAGAYEAIENHEERPDPWVINGCTIGPKAECPNADLRFSDLRGANLNGANLENGRIAGADMSGADFTVANLEMTQAKRAKFVGAKFLNTDMQEAKFQETDLTNASMEGPLLRFVNFENAWMQGCRGCPSHWQSNKPVWESFPLEAAPTYPEPPAPAGAKAP